MKKYSNEDKIPLSIFKNLEKVRSGYIIANKKLPLFHFIISRERDFAILVNTKNVLIQDIEHVKNWEVIADCRIKTESDYNKQLENSLKIRLFSKYSIFFKNYRRILLDLILDYEDKTEI